MAPAANPTAAIAPSADLVLWSRIGSAYDPRELEDALDAQSILEYPRHAAGRGGPGPLPGRDGGLAGGRWPRDGLAAVEPSVGGGQRGVPAGHPRAAALRRAAADQRAPRHVRAAVEVDGLEQQPQRHDAARPDGADGRRRRRGWHGSGPALGPGRARLPAGSPCAARGSVADPRRASARGPRHRPVAGARAPRRAGRRRGGRRGRGRRGCAGAVAGRPGTARRPVHRPGRAALPVRPAPARPQAHDRHLRVRLHPRDVQAGRVTPLGLLRAPGARRRPAGGQARRDGRRQGRRAAGPRGARGRPVERRRARGRRRARSRTSRSGWSWTCRPSPEHGRRRRPSAFAHHGDGTRQGRRGCPRGLVAEQLVPGGGDLDLVGRCG